MKKTLYKFAIIATAYALGINTSYSQDYENRELYGNEIGGYSITKNSSSDTYVTAGTKYVNSGSDIADINILQTAYDGTPGWSRDLNFGDDDRCFHIGTYPSGYVITGYVDNGMGVNEAYMALINSSGAVTLSKTFSEMGNRNGWNTHGMHVIYTNGMGQPGFLITGFMSDGYSTTNRKSIMLIRTDMSGNTLWTSVYDSPSTSVQLDMDMGEFALEVDNHGYFITGSVNMPKNGGTATNQGTLALMVDFSGNHLWDNNIASYALSDPNTHMDVGASAIIHPNNGNVVLIANSSINHTLYVSELNVMNGTAVMNTVYPSLVATQDLAGFTIDETLDGDDGFLITGITKNHNFSVDCNTNGSGSVPFLLQIDNSSYNVLYDTYYKLDAPNYSTVGGSFFGAFGSLSPIPTIATPEMCLYTSGRATTVSYKEAASVNTFDLQFVSSTSSKYAWCYQDPMMFKDNHLVVEQVMSLSDVEHMIDGMEIMFNVSTPTIQAEECSPDVCDPNNWPVEGDASAGIGASAATSSNLVTKDGNTYVAGDFDGVVTIGTSTITNTDPNWRMFVTQIDECGNVDWVRTTTGTAGHNAATTGIAVDGNGNVNVCGYFTTGTLDFGEGIVLDAVETVENGGWSSYIVQYSSTGVPQWAIIVRKTTLLSGAFIENLGGLQVDNSNNIYMSGTCKGDLQFPGTVVNFPGAFNAYVAQFNSAGIYQWANNSGTSNTECSGRDMAINASTGETYVTGFYIHSTSGKDLPFVHKRNSTGTITGQTYASGSSNAYANTIAYRGGSVIVGGKNSTTLSGQSVSGGGWLVKMNTSLSGSASTSIAGSGIILDDVIIGPSDELYVLGSTTGTATIGGKTSTMTSGSSRDVFVGKYSSAFTGSWVNSYGGASATAFGGSIWFEEDDCSVHVDGWYTGGVNNLGPGTLSNAGGAYNLFVGRVTELGSAYKSGASLPFNDDDVESSEVQVYPNPASSIVTIQYPSRDEAQYEIVIYNVMGQPVLSERSSLLGKIELNVSELNTGVYFYELIENGDKLSSGAFVKE